MTKEVTTVQIEIEPRSLILQPGTEDSFCMNWTIPSNQIDEFGNRLLDGEDFDSLVIQISTTVAFLKELTNDTIMSQDATSGCFQTSKPLHLEVVYMRVRGMVGEAFGTASIPTPQYETSLVCGDEMYLCRKCWPPTRPGAWLVRDNMNQNVEDWRCQGKN